MADTENNIPGLDPNSPLPLYRQLSAILRQEIESGKYKNDTQIPTEQVLSQQYGISRITVRKALEELTDEGLLVRRQGKGTFVHIGDSVQTIYPFMPFNEAVRAAGKQPATRLISYSTDVPARKIATFLGLSPKEEAIVLRRLRFADDDAIALETDYFPTSFDFLASEPLTGSSSEVLRSHNIQPLHGKNTISICFSTEEEARLLHVDVDAPLLYVYSEIRDQNQKPIQVSKQIIRSELYKLVMTS